MEFELLSREDCHLCDELESALAGVVAGKATIKRVDIDEDPVLARRFGMKIPLVFFAGRQVSGYPLHEPSIRSILETGPATDAKEKNPLGPGA